jgi:ferric-dicitrate binding protein FerR (iron transport regulator)
MKSNKKIHTAEMLRLYLRNRYALETEEKIQEWLANNPEIEGLEQASKEYWNSIPPQKDTSTIVALKRVNTKIGVHPIEKKIIPLNHFLRVAAIFIFLIGISGIWFYLKQHDHPAMVEILAEYGETKKVTLPDQTVVWLNAGSSLTYPAEFQNKIRSVGLSGEAFFSVTKNKSKPFVVETKNLTVKVLGTKFNLKAYPNEHQTIATLQEGKIEVQADKQQKRQLIPNEQLVYNGKTSTLKVIKINPNDIPNWKSGKLRFAEATLAEILVTLERHFNISFDINKSIDLTTEHYTIKFEKNETTKQILEVLADITGTFSYSTKNGQIVLHNK